MQALITAACEETMRGTVQTAPLWIRAGTIRLRKAPTAAAERGNVFNTSN